MAWDLTDYLIATGLLGFLVGGAYFIARNGKTIAYRAGMGLALLSTVLLFWINGAVGIIGASDNPANLMVIGIIVIAILSSIMARFRPKAMILAMAGTALAQSLVGAVAIITQTGVTNPKWPMDIIILTGIFITLWLASAWLFYSAARSSKDASP